MSDRAAFLDRYFAFTAAGHDDRSATAFAADVQYDSPPPLPVTSLTEEQRAALAKALGPNAWADRILADSRRVRVVPEASVAPLPARVMDGRRAPDAEQPSSPANILAMSPEERNAHAVRVGNDAYVRQLNQELRTTKVTGG